MELSDFDNGIEKYARRISTDVEKQGYSLSMDNKFVYSVGMNAKGLPECILDRRNMSEQEAVTRIKTVLNANNDLEGASRIVRRLSRDEIKRTFYAARLFYGHWNIEAVEVTGIKQ